MQSDPYTEIQLWNANTAALKQLFDAIHQRQCQSLLAAQLAQGGQVNHIQNSSTAVDDMSIICTQADLRNVEGPCGARRRLHDMVRRRFTVVWLTMSLVCRHDVRNITITVSANLHNILLVTDMRPAALHCHTIQRCRLDVRYMNLQIRSCACCSCFRNRRPSVTRIAGAPGGRCGCCGATCALAPAASRCSRGTGRRYGAGGCRWSRSLSLSAPSSSPSSSCTATTTSSGGCAAP